MKVVGISLDPKVLDSKSSASYRNRLYGTIVDEYRVVVHYHADTILELSENVTIYGVGGKYKFIRLIRVGLLLRRFVKEGSCDVITSSDPYYFGFVAYAIARVYHVGFEAHILGIEKLTFIRKLVARFFVRHAGSVRVNSTRLADRVAKEFDVPRETIVFVPIYVPTENLGFALAAPGSHTRDMQDTLTEDFNLKYSDRFNIIFVGRLVAVKNVAMQLRALSLLKDSHPEILLHVVGEGPEAEELQELARNLNVEKQVVFHGRQEGLELGTFYRLADCFVLTSNAEGWPMVIFEAMTAGLVIVMTDVGCAGEMIINDKNGLVVPVNDAAALADAFARLIEEEGLMARLIRTASTHIKNYWTKEQILAGYQQSWQKAKNNRV